MLKNDTISLSPAMPATRLDMQARYMVFESGTSTGDTRIRVTSENGDTITLKPGQTVRFAEPTPTITIALNDPAVTLTGNIITGEGDFADNNTTIASISGAVSVSNFPATTFSTLADANGTTNAVAGTAQAITADPTLKRFIVRNTHATALIYLGAAGVTVAKAAIKLAPGEAWIEELAPGATWHCISDTNSATYAIQTAK